MITKTIVSRGVYTAPSLLLRADVRPAASAEGRCFLHIVERWGERAYLAYVAASLENLQDDDRAFVVVLTEEQLEWATLSAHSRAGDATRDVGHRGVGRASPQGPTHPRAEGATRYVAPARILPPHLRVRASCAGLCYFVLEGAPDEQGQVRVRVAALAERLSSMQAHTVHAAALGPQALAQALPVTRELGSLPTCDLRWQVEEHASRVTGTPFQEGPQAEPAAVAEGPATTLEIEIPFDEVQREASGRLSPSHNGGAAARPNRVDLALLLVRAALRVVTIMRGRERIRGSGARGRALAEQELWLRSMLVWRKRWCSVPGQFVQVVEVNEAARCTTVCIGIHPSLLVGAPAEVEVAA